MESSADAFAIVCGSDSSHQLGPIHNVIEGEPDKVLDAISAVVETNCLPRATGHRSAD